MRKRPSLAALLLCLLLPGCRPPAEERGQPAATAPTQPPALPARALDPEVPQAAIATLRALFPPVNEDLRYFARAVDLDGDGRAEVVAEVLGDMLCGDDGCSLFVLAGDEGGHYRVLSQIAPADAPVYAGAAQADGWRDLLVGAGDGRGGRLLVRLRHDGRGYPDPATARTPVSAAPADADLLIAPYRSPQEAAALGVQLLPR